MQNANEVQSVILRLEDEVRLQKEKVNLLNRKLRDKEHQLNELSAAYNNMQNSFSYRLGRRLTWLPRTGRRAVQSIKEHGLKHTTKFIFKKIAEKVLPKGFYQIWRHFQDDIMNGYNHYARIMEKYGLNTQIYKTSGGTGDVYVTGLYFKEYLRVHNVQCKPVFTVIRSGGYAVAELFGIENIELISYSDRRSMVHLGIFVGFQNIHFTVIHHHPNSLYTSIGQKMETVHDMSYFDVLESTIFDGISPTGIPIFDNDVQYIEKMFIENKLCIGKTVVLTPYSVSMKPIPKQFWEKMVDELLKWGYTVCTNSRGADEPPIRGTNAVNVPIKYLVPFLNMAGVLVGVRSGIIDVSATANAKMVIFYSEVKGAPRGQGGHNRRFYPHFPFGKWFKRDDVLEIEYNEEFKEQYLEEILTYLQNT